MDEFDLESIKRDTIMCFDPWSGSRFYASRSQLELCRKKLEEYKKEVMAAEMKFTLLNYWKMFGHYFYAKCPDWFILLKGAV